MAEPLIRIRNTVEDPADANMKKKHEIKPMAAGNLPRDQPESTDIAKTYEPTPDERSAIDTLQARRKRTPKLRVTEQKGKSVVSLDHPDMATGEALLMNTLGTTEPDFLHGIINQLANAACCGPKVNEGAVNFLLSVVKGIDPKDQLETMLAAQMGTVHMLTMTFAWRLANADNIPARQNAEIAFNKFARTFTMRMEALKRYRSTGEQKVTVEHVTVNEGGKAIVGNVAHGGQGASKKPETTS
jgi:hypothetical protein